MTIMLGMLMAPVFELIPRTSFVYLSKNIPREGTVGGFCSRAASLTCNLHSMAACFSQGALFLTSGHVSSDEDIFVPSQSLNGAQV